MLIYWKYIIFFLYAEVPQTKNYTHVTAVTRATEVLCQILNPLNHERTALFSSTCKAIPGGQRVGKKHAHKYIHIHICTYTFKYSDGIIHSDRS